MGLDWGEWGNSGVCVGLVLLAYSTAYDVLSHEMCETQPPEFRGNKLIGLEVARMTSGFVVVTPGKDCYDSPLFFSFLFFSFGLFFSFLLDLSLLFSRLLIPPHHQPADLTCLRNHFLPSASSDFYDSSLLTRMYFFAIPSHSTMFLLLCHCSRTL